MFVLRSNIFSAHAAFKNWKYAEPARLARFGGSRRAVLKRKCRSGFENVAAMGETVEQRGRHLGVAEQGGYGARATLTRLSSTSPFPPPRQRLNSIATSPRPLGRPRRSPPRSHCLRESSSNGARAVVRAALREGVADEIDGLVSVLLDAL